MHNSFSSVLYRISLNGVTALASLQPINYSPEPVTTWKKKFNELQQYKATFGNTMVPQRYQANPQLGTWVHTQRRQFKLMKEGKKSSMTQEKVDALNSIEFIWVAKNVGDETQAVGYVEKKESDCSAKNEGVGADV
jgi:hypothetical protein